LFRFIALRTGGITIIDCSRAGGNARGALRPKMVVLSCPGLFTVDDFSLHQQVLARIHLGRRNPRYIVILSEVARAFAFPAFFAGAQTQSKDLSRIENVAVAQIGERFFDCVSRRFAQNQERGTLRSE
jgi:hypothetical protein